MKMNAHSFITAIKALSNISARDGEARTYLHGVRAACGDGELLIEATDGAIAGQLRFSVTDAAEGLEFIISNADCVKISKIKIAPRERHFTQVQIEPRNNGATIKVENVQFEIANLTNLCLYPSISNAIEKLGVRAEEGSSTINGQKLLRMLKSVTAVCDKFGLAQIMTKSFPAQAIVINVRSTLADAAGPGIFVLMVIHDKRQAQ